MTTQDLTAFEPLARAFADSRSELSTLVQELQDDIHAIRRAAMPAIKRALARATDRRAALSAAVQAAPELFAEPRTHTVHGVNFGLAKGKGRITWDDESAVVARIEKLFGADAESYLNVTKKPSRPALLRLDTSALKKLGCTVDGTGDRVVIRDAVGEIDKLVERLLADDQFADTETDET